MCERAEVEFTEWECARLLTEFKRNLNDLQWASLRADPNMNDPIHALRALIVFGFENRRLKRLRGRGRVRGQVWTEQAQRNAFGSRLRIVVGILALLTVPACTGSSPVEQKKLDDPIAPTVKPLTTELTPIHPSEHLVLKGPPSPPVDLADGRRAYSFGPIFMKNSLSKARGPVFLHARGITVAPDSEADIYLANQQGQLIPYAYIGVIETVPGGPTEIREVVHELNENSRTELRSMAHFGVVLAVTKGSVTVDEFILSLPAD
jgi:hypothetical protein